MAGDRRGWEGAGDRNYISTGFKHKVISCCLATASHLSQCLRELWALGLNVLSVETRKEDSKVLRLGILELIFYL